MSVSYWVFKTATLGAVIVGLDWIHYRDFHGKQLSDAFMMLLPYVLSLLMPKKWLGPAIAIPIGAALVLLGPLALALVFIAGNKMDVGSNFRLLFIFISIAVAAVASVVAGIRNRTTVQGWAFICVTLGAILYYVVMLL